MVYDKNLTDKITNEIKKQYFDALLTYDIITYVL